VCSPGRIKPLPSSLRYEFLRPNSTYPVIVNVSLSASQIDSSLRILRMHRKAIEYTLDDSKGIHPFVCMCILTEDDHKTLIERQTRLTPNIEEVVKKKILKLLKASIIYPISDNKWVSPVHVVSKKGEMAVIKMRTMS